MRDLHCNTETLSNLEGEEGRVENPNLMLSTRSLLPLPICTPLHHSTTSRVLAIPVLGWGGKYFVHLSQQNILVSSRENYTTTSASNTADYIISPELS